MKYLEYPPPPSLATFIKCYWSLSDSSLTRCEIKDQFLTEGGMELVFNLGDSFSVINDQSVFNNHGGAFAIGPMTRAQWGHTEGKCHLFGVCFLPGGYLPCASFPAQALADRCKDAEDLWGAEIKGIAGRLRDKPDDAQAKIDILNRFFQRQIGLPSPDYRILFSSIRMIRQSGGRLPIEILALELKIKRRRLERIFNRMVGISPKKISNLIRIKNAISCMTDPSFDGWAGLANDAGYFDQAHFIREFKTVTGMTPAAYKAFRGAAGLM